ncbi:WhiB family transcriptional regulator [Streptomyces seoulensis]
MPVNSPRSHNSRRAADSPVPGPWQADAACLCEDPELFFPVGEAGPALRQVEEAKAVCRRCPVLSQCLDWAVAHGVLGVWGGLTDDERRTVSRRARQVSR